MTNRPQQIARLRCVSFLIEEALRMADEGDMAVVAAKLSEANDRILHDLKELNEPREKAVSASVPSLALIKRSITYV
jgi:hypothetical protein